MAIPKRVGPQVAIALLDAFLRRQWELNEDEADQLFDEVIALLERARDDRYRLKPSDPNES